MAKLDSNFSMGLDILLQNIDAACVAMVMRTFERSVMSVFNEHIWVYNRGPGPERNKNYKMWGKLTYRLRIQGWEPREYMEFTLRSWSRYHDWATSQGKKVRRIPYVSQVGSAIALSKFDAALKTPDYQRSRIAYYEVGDRNMWHWKFELREGASIVYRAMKFCKTDADAIQFCWRALPIIFLALWPPFWVLPKSDYKDQIECAMRGEAFELRRKLKPDTVRWRELNLEYAAAWDEVRAGKYT